MLLLHICLAAYCFSMLQKVQSAAELAANDIMAEEEKVAVKAAAKKVKKQKQKAKKQRAPQQASSDTDLLTTEAISPCVDLGQQDFQQVSRQLVSRATPTQAPNPQPAKPVSTLLADSHFTAPGAMVNSAGKRTGAADEVGPVANAATSCSQPVLHDCLDSVHDLSTPSADKAQLPNQWPASPNQTSSLNSSSSKSHVQSVKHRATGVTTQAVTASVQYDPVAKPSEQGQHAHAGLLLCCPMTKVSPGQALKSCGLLTRMSSFHLQSCSMHDMTYCYAAK